MTLAAFGQIADTASKAVGHPFAIPVSGVLIGVLYLALGLDPTNIAISIVSLFLLCLIQATQNRDGLAIQVKLDELIRSSHARNQFIGVDHKTQDEILRLRDNEAHGDGA